MTPDNRATRVRGTRDNNLKKVDIPRDAVVVLTGISGSG